MHFLLRKCRRLRRRRCRAVFTLFSGAVDAVSLSLRNRLWHSMLSKAVQKAVFCIAKDGLLAAKTWPFARQNTAYWQPTTAKRTTHPNPPEGRELDYLFPVNPYRVNRTNVADRANACRLAKHIKLPPFGRVGVGCPFGWGGLPFWSGWVLGLVVVGGTLQPGCILFAVLLRCKTISANIIAVWKRVLFCARLCRLSCLQAAW